MKTFRNLLFVATGLVVLLAGFGLPTEPVQAAVQNPEIVAISDGSQVFDVVDTRPDIITIMVDDLGYIRNDRVLKHLPNIKKHFLDGGVRLTGMYNEGSLCCPMNASYETGQYINRHGVWKNDGRLLNHRQQTPTVTSSTS